MLDFFPHLFDPSGFTPRSAGRGGWTLELVWLHNISDGLIWLAYYTIPVVLVYFIRRRKDLPFSWMFWLFAAFLVGCGTTHLMEVVTFYVPLYRLSGLIKVVTAVASVGTAVLLVPLVPRALALRGPQEFQREIEERRRSERELEIQTKILREQALLLDLAHDAILVRDLEDRITFWNQGAVEEYGWSKEEAAGQVKHMLLQTEFPQPLEDIRDKLMRDGRWEGELTYTRRDGGRIVVVSRWVVKRDGWGHAVGVLEINRDITAQKQAKAELQRANAVLESSNEALRRGEELFRTMVEGVKDYAIFRLDPEGKVVTWNAGAERIKGYKAEEIIGHSFSAFYPAQDRERGEPERGLREAVEKGRFESEGWRVRKDGSRFVANVIITPLFDRAGRLQGYTKVTRDITERKEMERQIQKHTEELEQRTREQQEANAALQAFGYSVSHDLRTPLRNMQLLAQALEEDYGSQLDAGGRDFCQRIVAAGRKMDTLINDLLAYSRISRSDLPLGSVDLNGVLAEAQTTLADDIRDSQAEVTVEGSLPHVFGHRTTLVQIVVNLLANAVKYIALGVQPKVRVWGEVRGGFVRLWIEDNGIGIAPEHQQRIFNVFERLHGEESYSGTGIGLAIVKKGVERMGGRTGVESEPGRGSRFWVDIPQRG